MEHGAWGMELGVWGMGLWAWGRELELGVEVSAASGGCHSLIKGET
ncbi:MAG: hypothetical protein U5L00_09460 [Desulfovermiculus sp.]|nr:hypothetical protein [Desulfovermiculus sp.]